MTANRVQRASDKKRRMPLALFIVPAVLVVGGVILLFFLGGGTDKIPIIGGDSHDDTVPPFDFTTKKVAAIATVSGADELALETSAEQTGAEITPTLDDLFTNAFLDPSNWREGDYEEVFAAFAPEAVPAAQDNVETLTLGATAGDVFEKVRPQNSTLRYRVLFDGDGNPETAVVEFSFNAKAERQDGTYLAIVSDGQLFLQNVDGWKITAFDVTRSDAEAPAPGTGATGGSGASTTPGATGSS